MIRKTGNPELVKALYPDHSTLKTTFKIVMMVVAFALGVVALANPRKPDENSAEARKGIDIIIALDVSNSMKAKDIEPDRLSRAKQFISRLIDNLQDDRL